MTATKPRKYSDLNLSFYAHPVTGDISKLVGVDAIKRSIRSLILTDFYERPFQPNLGCGVAQSLFENINLVTKHKLQSAIEDVIRNYEPRAKLILAQVTVAPDNNSVNVSIVYEQENLLEPVKFNVIVERIR